jgi:hypothetical protein
VNHWHEWKYAGYFKTCHRQYPSVGKHRVAVMVEAERIDYDHFRTIKPGRTFCGITIGQVQNLSPHPPRMSAYESWMEGWRPCVRCFPEFDLKTAQRMVDIDRRWSDKGEKQMERVSHLLYKVVEAHR